MENIDQVRAGDIIASERQANAMIAYYLPDEPRPTQAAPGAVAGGDPYLGEVDPLRTEVLQYTLRPEAAWVEFVMAEWCRLGKPRHARLVSAITAEKWRDKASPPAATVASVAKKTTRAFGVRS